MPMEEAMILIRRLLVVGLCLVLLTVQVGCYGTIPP